MSLQANETHMYQTQALAKRAAEAKELDPADLHFYRASKRWGWCTKAEAEAAEQASNPVVEGEDDQSPEAIMARNAARAAQKALEQPAAPPVTESEPAVQEASAAVVADPAPVIEAQAPVTVHEPVSEAPVSAQPDDRMVILVVDGGSNPELLADILRVACNSDVTAVNARTFEQQWVVPAHPVQFVKDGQEPSLVEAAFIAGALREGGITSTAFSERCKELRVKVPGDLCALGEHVEGYGPTYSVTPETVSRTRIDLRHALTVTK